MADCLIEIMAEKLDQLLLERLDLISVFKLVLLFDLSVNNGCF